MVRFATIGTNIIVENFLESVADVKELEYISTYSRNEETAVEFSKKHGSKRYDTNLLELAKADDIDGVYIASPNSLHYEQAILMLSNKKHVLCEKIIASNEEELQEMFKVAKENNVIILEAMRSVFDKGFEAICNNINKLGKIRRASFQYCQYSSRYDKFKQGIIENAFNPDFSNGAIMDIGIYCVYPMVHLFGMPKKIYSDAIILENGIDGAGTILFAYDDMQGEAIYSKISNNYLPSQIQGENATMTISEIANTKEINIYYKNGDIENIIIEKPKHNLMFEAIAWVDFIENGIMPESYNKSSMMSIKVIDEARNQLGIIFPADNKNM